MGKIDTKGLQFRVADVVLPCQSYLSEVPDSVALCCSDVNLDKFSLLSASFGQSGFTPDYNPWTYWDILGRSSIYKSFMSSHRSALSGSKVCAKSAAIADTSSVKDAPAVKLSSDSKRRRMDKSLSRSRSSSVIVESTAGFSKD